MEEKFVYVVYGLDFDVFDNLSSIVADPTIMEVFDTREKAMKFFKDTCIKIAKNEIIGGDDGEPVFADVPEEELFNDVTISEIDENLSIEFWEDDNRAEWLVCVGNEDDEDYFDVLEDYENTTFPRMFIKKVKLS